MGIFFIDWSPPTRSSPHENLGSSPCREFQRAIWPNCYFSSYNMKLDRYMAQRLSIAIRLIVRHSQLTLKQHYSILPKTLLIGKKQHKYTTHLSVTGNSTFVLSVTHVQHQTTNNLSCSGNG